MNSDAVDPPIERDLPPLRIHHFMLWTAVTAVLFTVLKIASDDEAGTSFLQNSSMLYLVTQALALTGLGLGITWKLQGMRFFYQPGHMAYISQSFTALFMVTWAILWKSFGMDSWASDDSTLLRYVLFYGWYAVFLAHMVLSLIYAYVFRKLRRWRYFFAFDAFTIVLQLIGYLIINFWLAMYSSTDQYRWFLIQSSWPLICATPVVVFLTVIAWKDYRQPVDYHWTHWLGVSISFAMWFAVLIGMIWSLIFPPEWITSDVIESQFIIE